MILLTTNAHSWAAETPLTASTDLSNEGYFVLSWDTADPEASLVLEQSSSSAFDDDVIPRDVAGAGALTITGLEDGSYYFRLSNRDSPQSDPVQVTVQHHSLARAGSFFLLGLVLFSILIFTIINGNQRANL